MKTGVLILLGLCLLGGIGYLYFNKANSLQERAKRFLEMPVPEGMSYVSDSMAERFIVEYAETGKANFDPELSELLQIVVMESSIVKDARPGTEEAFMNESALILQGILNELNP